MIPRILYPRLVQWKNSPRRKPLILQGARQVGKTALLKLFGETEYDTYAYFNFEEDRNLAPLFEGKLAPAQLIEKLQFYSQNLILPHKTLLIFDEIQLCSQALTSLKYFNEQANEYHIACAGSHLELALGHQQSFPVGKVNFETLYPLNFQEFLRALGREQLFEALRTELNSGRISAFLHADLMQLLRYYLYVGGMPEAVATYAALRDPIQVRSVQRDIVRAYLLDFAKHAGAQDIVKISRIWDSIPRHLAKENKKFIFTAIKTGARARDYESSLQWLLSAGLITKVINTETLKVPIMAYADTESFKVYLIDVGLLGSLVDLQSDVIVRGHELFTEFKGAMTENFIAQELRAHGIEQLYYWTSSAKAEVDFVFERGGRVQAMEVKSGERFRIKSIQSLLAQSTDVQAVVLSASNIPSAEKIRNIPLYALSAYL
jgi:predicted AAA+ superfamily ATPase